MHLRTRFAPTPSGFLHQGNLFNLAITWHTAYGSLPDSFLNQYPDLIAKAVETADRIRNSLGGSINGEALLRIDDLDTDRVRDEYLLDIRKVLERYGMVPHNIYPADDVSWFYARQSSRKDRFHEVLSQISSHPFVFACTCSRNEIGHSPYPGTCLQKNLSLDTPGAAWRIHVPRGTVIRFQDHLLGLTEVDLGERTGSFVIRRKDGVAAYQLASLIDDIDMQTNLLIRGEDLLESTAMQLFLAQTLGWSSFEKTQFAHHALIKDGNGRKLSKSQQPLE